jgi:hypothetical protein
MSTQISVVKNEGKTFSGYVSLRGEHFSFVLLLSNEGEAHDLIRQLENASLMLNKAIADKPDYVNQFEWAKAVADQQERLEPFDGEGYSGEEKV